MAYLCTSSPCSMRIRQLREKNRALLDQLETNSALLERRLKKLRKTARTKKHSDKSWQDLPPSPLKRKYDSWKARNYSGQVSAALNANIYNLSSANSDSVELTMKSKQSMGDIRPTVMSPAKRSKRNIPNPAKSRKKESCKRCCSPPKPCTEIHVSKNIRNCAHSKKTSGKDEAFGDLSSQEGRGSASSSLGSLTDHKIEESYRICFEDNGSNKKTSSEREERTLGTACALIDYTPESVFLRRLKERALSAGDLVASGNIRKPLTNQQHISPSKTSRYNRSTTRLSCRTINSSPVKTSRDMSGSISPYSVCEHRKSQEKTLQHTPSPQKKKTEKYVGRHSHRNENKNTIRPRPNRKRVCYRKQCYCRIQQDLQSRKNSSSDTKENKLIGLGLDKNVPGLETAPCDCHISREQDVISPKSPLTTDNRTSMKHDKNSAQAPCCRCCKQTEKWFDDINEFRQSHWFDCHAYPPASRMRLDAKSCDGRNCQPLDHKCIHKYTLDDRLNPRPVYADHHRNSRCLTCHLPSALGIREAPVVTLPSALKNPEIRVTFPIASSQNKQRYPSASGNVLSNKVTSANGRGRATRSPRGKTQSRLLTRTIGELRPQPPPADSLALRYQKGVAK